MGKIRINTRFWNFIDEVNAQAGLISKEQSRSLEEEALIDTGATMLILPKKIADRLGTMPFRKTIVRYAKARARGPAYLPRQAGQELCRRVKPD